MSEAVAVSRRAGDRSRGEVGRVLLAGNPNAGKTTLFNALSGSRARVGNYPGTTVDRRSARLLLPSGRKLELVDVPGTYSLSARSPEEQVAVDAVLGRSGPIPDAIVVVADATTLARHLYLALQLLETGVPVVLALNMMDEARRAGFRIDERALAASLGVPVIPLVASKHEGLDELRKALDRVLDANTPSPDPHVTYGSAVESEIAIVERSVPCWIESASPRASRAWALFCLLSLGNDELDGVPDVVRRAVDEAHARAAALGENLDQSIIAARYAKIDAIVAEAVRTPAREVRSRSERIDGILTHPVFGLLSFAMVMFLVFEALFSWSEPLVAGVEALIVGAQAFLTGTMGEGPLRDLLVHGVVQGVGNVLVFVPQIALLFLFLAFLEDSGYLARVAFVIDRLMSAVGLHGKAFVPLLSGFGCAVPAVMATRTIENRRDRLVTMLALPLMSCSARLPIYVLVVAVVFAGQGRVFGVFSVGAVVLFGMYAFSVLATLAAAAVLRRTVLRGPRPTLVLELPPYRLPLPRNLATATWQRVRTFLVDAGTVILAFTIVLWALLSYPKSEAIEARFEAERALLVETSAGEVDDERLEQLESRFASAQLEHSVAGRIGRAMEPLLLPLGFDWRIGVGILGSFAARELFISTLGIVFALGDADEASEPLRDALRSATHADGAPLLTPLTGVALMIFFVLACQCMSTIAVVRKESGSWKWPLLMFTYMTGLAYVVTFLVQQVGRALGWGVA